MVAIIAIIISISAPGFVNVIKRGIIQSEAKAFLKMMQLARSEAISRGNDMMFCGAAANVDTCAADAAHWGNGNRWLIRSPVNRDGDFIPTNLHVNTHVKTDVTSPVPEITFKTNGFIDNPDNTLLTFRFCAKAKSGYGKQVTLKADGVLEEIDIAGCAP